MTEKRKKLFGKMLNVRLDDSLSSSLRAAADRCSVDDAAMSESVFVRLAIANQIARTLQQNGMKVKVKTEETLAKEVIEMLENLQMVLRQIDSQTRKTEAWSVLIAKEMGVQL